MDERAAAVGVQHQPTPEGLREIIKDGDPAAAAEARQEVKRHKLNTLKRVGRAEVAQEKWQTVREGLQIHMDTTFQGTFSNQLIAQG